MQPDQDGVAAARRLWELYEALHDVVYFTDECRDAAAAAGLRGFWMGYFAFRAAPLGAVSAAPVTAAFYGFHPDRAARALPDAWTFTTPEAAVAAREQGAAAALRRICGPLLEEGLDETVELAWRAADAVDVAGRPLGAANHALPRPSDPVAALWQACTTLREHRGDGHVAALVTRGIDPVASHVLKTAATEGSDPELLRGARRWSAEDWADAVDTLTARGWLDQHARLGPAGRREHDEIERRTDAAAARPWSHLGPADTDRLARRLDPLARAVHAGGVLPRGNPTGLPGRRRSAPRHTPSGQRPAAGGGGP